MPNVKQMFPSKFLQPHDLTGVVAVTIDWVKPLRAELNPLTGQIETEWVMRLREFQKPMKLKGPVASTIAQVLGTEDTDQWPGQRIEIAPGQCKAWGKILDVINATTTRLALPPGQARGAFEPAKMAINYANRKPIGLEAAGRFKDTVTSLGSTFDAFMAWLKNVDQQAHDLTVGVALGDIPMCVTGLMKRYMDELAEKAKAAAAGSTPAGDAGEDEIPF